MTSLPYTIFAHCGQFARKRFLMKGLINQGETSSLVGPPGCGKSALQTEIAVHCASGTTWLGHDVRSPCGVLIFALERGDLYRRRLHAYAVRDNLANLPIAVCDASIDLLDETCVDVLAATARAAGDELACEIGLIIIDTFSKGIAAGGGDEDKARDQNKAAAHLRELHHRLDVHVALVGHTGKNEDRGARGSNAHLADVDLMMQISGKGQIKTIAVVKANDQALRAIGTFSIEEFSMGVDEEGDAITAGIASACLQAASQARNKKPSPASIRALATLEELACEAGGVSLPFIAWRDACIRDGLIDNAKPASARALMSKYVRELSAAKLIFRDGDLVIVSQDNVETDPAQSATIRETGRENRAKPSGNLDAAPRETTATAPL